MLSQLLRDIMVSFERDSGLVLRLEAEVTEICLVANLQGVLATGYLTYNAGYRYSHVSVSIILRQDDTLHDTRPSDGQAICEETQWRMWSDGTDGAAGIIGAEEK